MSGPAPHLHGRQRRRWQEHADRAAAVRLARRSTRTRCSRSRAASQEPHRRPDRLLALHRRPARPSASRASRSTSRTATSRRRAASSSSPTRPATSSTRATWRPAPRRPTWPSCSSTRGTACRDADAAPRAHRAAARHHRLRPGRQQDGPGRLRPRRVRRHLRRLRGAAATARRVTPIPMSALHGDNVIAPSDRTPWFDGQSLLEYLETVEVDRRRGRRPSGSRCSSSLRPDQDFRGYAGQIASGIDPRRRRDHRLAVRPDERASSASSPGTATSRWRTRRCRSRSSLEDEIDISRGDVLAVGPIAGRPALHGRRRVDGRTAARPGARLPAEARRRATVTAEVDRGWC